MNAPLQLGTIRWFEYHGWESPHSAGAELWYRSHQRVTIGDCVNWQQYGDLTYRQRQNNKTPLVYKVLFQDGFLGIAFEDELFDRRSLFFRPNPPKRITR